MNSRKNLCANRDNLLNTELRILTDLNSNVVVNTQTTLFATQNQTRQDGLFQAIGINNKGINSKLKRVTKTALCLGPKCNYIMLQLTQKEELFCPKL